ncbi:MAG: GntR family transcriptional regulator [Rhodoglobus sp.]|nr:GntR family transcriptional regulator [Rhodoglobus sp.]
MRASDRAYALLRDEILEWQLAPGTILGEVEQSTRLGISRTPLREALARLTADGLVETQAGRGLVVADASIDSVAELFEVRLPLEQEAAALAARRRNPHVFEQLRREMADATTLLADPRRHAYYELVRRFDEAMDDAVQNTYLVTALRGLRTHLARIRRLAHDNPARLSAAASEHLLIIDAIIAGDESLARSATAVHLHQSLRNILDTAQAPSTDRTA